MQARDVRLHLILLGIGLEVAILMALFREPRFASLPLFFTAYVMLMLSGELWRASEIPPPETKRKLRMLAIGTAAGAAIAVVIALASSPPVGH